MTAHTRPVNYSGRPSDRVVSPRSSPEVEAGNCSGNAPESMTRRRRQVAPVAARRARLAEQGVRQLASELSPRDWQVLVRLQQHRFLLTTQLQRWHFAAHASPDAGATVCRRVLRRLAQVRAIEPLERRIGGIRAGSASFVWRIGPVGNRLLQLRSGEGIRQRRKEPSARHLDHCLAIAECHLTVVEASRRGLCELLQAETEPASWRRYLGLSGSPDILKPDLGLVTGTAEFEDHWFCEIDRGSESLPTLLRKCRQYETYRRTGQEQQRAGVFPLVVWVLPDELRRQKLSAALGSARHLNSQIFRLTTQARFADTIVEAAR